jgi:hypothetical protein
LTDDMTPRRADSTISVLKQSNPGGSLALGLVSLLFAAAFLPAPLAVLWDLNDECLRSTTWDTQRASWGTLARIPPLPVSKNDYLLVRTMVMGALLATAFLAIAGWVAARSRARGLALLAAYAVVQVGFMIGLIVAGQRFSGALEQAALRGDWMMHLKFESNVGATARQVGMLGMIYPAGLAIFYLLRSLGRSKTGRPAK